MKNHILFSTKDNCYIHSCRHKETIPAHPIMQRIIHLQELGISSLENDEVLHSYTKEEVNYYLKKYYYWKEMNIIDVKDDIKYTPLSAELIQKELENLQVITFVVTDKCNLQPPL